nr:lysine-rich arabinogalactan protein 19-like [Lolium perenne]
MTPSDIGGANTGSSLGNRPGSTFGEKKIPTASSLPTPRPRPKIPQPARSRTAARAAELAGSRRRPPSAAPAALAASAGSRRPHSLPLRAAPFPARPVPPPVRPSRPPPLPSGRRSARPAHLQSPRRCSTAARPLLAPFPTAAPPLLSPATHRSRRARQPCLPGLKKRRLLHSPSSLSA